MHNQSIINKMFSESWVLGSSARVWRRRGWSLLGWGWGSIPLGHRCAWVLLALAEGVWVRECWGVFGGSRDLVVLSSGENRVDWNDEVVHKSWPFYFLFLALWVFVGPVLFNLAYSGFFSFGLSRLCLIPLFFHTAL